MCTCVTARHVGGGLKRLPAVLRGVLIVAFTVVEAWALERMEGLL